MLWKKKDEDWGYIGNNVGESEEEAQTKLFTDPDYVKSIFQPFLEEDEQILWCMGGGKANTKNPIETMKSKYAIASIVIKAMVVIGILLTLFGKSRTAFINFLMFLPALLLYEFFPIIMILLVAGLIIWFFVSGKKGMNFAITDRRVVVFGYGQWIEAKFDDIVVTSVSMTKGNKGRIEISLTEAVDEIILWNIDDPYRVKYLLDKAIEDHLAKQF